ncbi:methyltransferase RsmF C-terminal domain-like protein [Cecembia lonarensis]|uniref:Ribosomal RNA small subunit methyltransferase F n=1 Tax=Cecembia lonarensis (strain CCUG 58316 / KCTC 22772 / LW9) TaxID=1225176 RepID=K1LGF6_CECL9|nr:ribosomal RNA small subunit methyltransferase F [Cecembia lonarensis]EKB49353.1 Ribosomal RNA small subunit methyltransferase F [Cecembia lonarensis LW9]
MSSKELPQAFEERMKEFLGKEEYLSFKQALEKEPVTSIRFNPFKKASKIQTSNKVPWSKWGFFLAERPSFTLDPLFHAGHYYVQEASSMFLEHILQHIKAPKGGLFLDLAAAPGGKSTLLSSFLGQEGFLVANEVIKSRAAILKENIVKWGLGNCLVTQNDPAHFSGLEGFFDLVLVDAPCSGEGMFRKDINARLEWSEDHVLLCAQRQERIMDKAGSLVKGGGYLIYSTCTFNEKENEEMLRFICSEFSYEPIRIPLDPSWGIVESTIEVEGSHYFGYRFYPHMTDGEGFFITILKRPEEAFAQAIPRIKDFKHPHINLESKQVQTNLIGQLGLPENSSIYSVNGSYFRLNESFKAHFEYLCRFVNVKYFGVELGKFNKDQFLPTHEWAVSVFPKNDFPQFELDKKDALEYLRKEDIQPTGLPEGWVLLTYQRSPIGWIKNLGNRTNNYYPKEWRIRMK